MTYKEMLQKIWDERKEVKYEIKNVEDSVGYKFSYGFVGRVSIENSAVYYVFEYTDEDEEMSYQYPLPLYLLESDKWEVINPKPLNEDDLFFQEQELE